MLHWHVHEKHYLESWSDARAFDGTASIIQPLIAPLYDGKNAHEVVQLFLKENFDKKDYDIVKEYWQKTTITPAAAALKTEAKPEAKPEEPAAKTDAKETTPAANTAAKEAPKTAAKAAAPVANAPAAAAPAAAVASKNFEDNWRKAVHDGVIPNTAAAPKTVAATTAFLSQPETKAAGSGSLEISILPDPCVYDVKIYE